MSRASVADADARADGYCGGVKRRSGKALAIAGLFSRLRDGRPARTTTDSFRANKPDSGRRSGDQQHPGLPLGTIVLARGRALAARWLLPTLVGAFVLALGLGLLQCSLLEQERILRSSTNTLDLLATLTADSLDKPGSGDATASATALLKRIGQNTAWSGGQRFLVTNPEETIIAANPGLAVGHTLARELGDGQIVTILGEKAGVMRIVLPSGEDALATARSLQAPLGQLIVLHRLDTALDGWRSTHKRLLTILAFIAAVLAALALANLRASAKRRRSDLLCQSMRSRIDRVLNSGRCGLWDWDLKREQIVLSQSMFEMLGLPVGTPALPLDVIGSLIHPADTNVNAIARAIEAGEAPISDVVFRMRKADGSWLWLRAKLERLDDTDGPHVAGVAIDITDTMLLEERTAKADMRLRDAVETISEAFVVWDAENKLVTWNSKFQRFHNLPDEALVVGTPYASVMEQGTPPLIHLQISLEDRQPEGARTFEAQLADGRWLQIDERRTKDGGYVSVGTDVTTLKRHEEQLIESERRLMHTVVDLRKSRQTLEAQAEQLRDLAERYLEQKAEAESASRAKSDFLANMGHELRTPLNAILGFSEMMILEAFGRLGAPQYLDYSRHIHSSGQHLLTMIADVLEMARLDAGRVRLQKESFDITDAVKAAVAVVSDTASANGIEIETDAARSAMLFADRKALEKILTILLNNAVKFTPAGGRVRLTSATKAGSLTLAVEDTGVGMPPEAVAKLGRPFEQFSSAMKDGMRGSGLGLAIARSLVELHEGTIEISAEEGTGTRVAIALPRRAAAIGASVSNIARAPRKGRGVPVQLAERRSA